MYLMSFRSLFDARKYGTSKKLSRRFSQQTQTGRAASEYTPELAKITAPHRGLSKRICCSQLAVLAKAGN
jgi:hypothetical protein